MDVFARLKAFRQAAYKNLCRSHDAMFELKDAIILTRKAYSLAELSLSPVFRRKWSSVYEAIQDARPQRNKLMRLYIEQIPINFSQAPNLTVKAIEKDVVHAKVLVPSSNLKKAESSSSHFTQVENDEIIQKTPLKVNLENNGVQNLGRVILAGDHTAWVRPDAPTLKERTTEHYSTSIANNKPVAPGQGYSTIVWVPEDSGSWALPLRHERITSWESPITKAVWQLKQVCKHLSVRPISLWDSEYGCAPFILKTADIKADKLMRLRSNLCLWTAPTPYSGRGRPRLHGNKFKLLDPQTWTTPNQILEQKDSKLGHIRISVWHGLHFRAAAKHPISLLRVERLNVDGSLRIIKPLWLAWVGEEMPPQEQLWRLYLRRFTVDHWYRFIKQRLHWTLPKLSTPQQCERWSELMLITSWELWLARDIVTDNPLPWQKSIDKLTPGRVAQAMGGIFAVIGTPANSPKPRGKSPGWTVGQARQRRNTYPLVKKRTSKSRKKASESA